MPKDKQTGLVDQEIPPDKMDGGGENFFTKKLGPLPVWVYIVVGGGLIAFLWYRNQQGGGQSIPGDLSGGGTSPGDTSGGSQDMSSELQSMQNQFSSQLQQAQQQTNANEQAMADAFNTQLQAQNQQFGGAIGSLQQGLSAQGQQFQQALQQEESNFMTALAQQSSQMQAGFAGVQAQQAQQQSEVQNILGQIVQVPSWIAAAGSQRADPSVLKAVGASSSGPTYVAGTHPASASSPAGGGVYQGLNDQQTAQLFQKTYGDNWQQVWQQQHAAAGG